ncbi:hypothetical protein SAMN05421743_106210 [Thalassobacillus cyri]|uniref:Uncharacterized protein n=1 Tax=Thalassobacillus cyri TaxID=571932 RepID=A0A1H4CV68_9BACI|nr:hypothetical protein SAMN05421743_106210 [Thalassobacillus cyri]
MTTVISYLIYIVILISASVILFLTVTLIWNTGDPGIIFLLSVICSQLLLSNLGEIGETED